MAADGAGELWWHEAAQRAGVDPERLATGEEDEPEPEPEPDLDTFLQAVIAEAAALAHTTPSEPVEQAHAAVLEAQTACFTALAAFEARVASRLGKSRLTTSGETRGDGSGYTSRNGKETLEARRPGVGVNNDAFPGTYHCITPSSIIHVWHVPAIPLQPTIQA